MRVVKLTIEQLIIRSLQQDLENPVREIQAALLKAVTECNKNENLLEPQINLYLNKAVLWLKEFFELFSFSTYIPVYGPVRPTVLVSNTPIDLEISGIFRSKNKQTIHALSFIPSGDSHAMLNDAPSHLKLKILSPFVKKHLQSGRPQVAVHVFAYGKNHNLQYKSYTSNDTNINFLKMIENKVKQLEAGHHFPVVPCLYRCPFKKTCFPGS